MQRGAFPLFRFGGIQVYLHFSWLIVAWFEISLGKNRYGSPGWAAAEYVGLFAIVLLHEFGHAFACRSTGGRADRIVLWPLGGLAFVDPPMRPGAVLWSIAAGPLVNVALYPVLHVAAAVTTNHGLLGLGPNLHYLAVYLGLINLGLLIFNLLPFYPLDGGQIVRALLWFKFGPIRSLMMAGVTGICGAALIGLFAFYRRSIWLGRDRILSVYSSRRRNPARESDETGYRSSPNAPARACAGISFVTVNAGRSRRSIVAPCAF